MIIPLKKSLSFFFKENRYCRLSNTSPRPITIQWLISLVYYLPIAEERIVEFIPFSKVIALKEIYLVSPVIWTRVAMSISYVDNHYITNASSIIQSLVRSLFHIYTDVHVHIYTYNHRKNLQKHRRDTDQKLNLNIYASTPKFMCVHEYKE